MYTYVATPGHLPRMACSYSEPHTFILYACIMCCTSGISHLIRYLLTKCYSVCRDWCIARLVGLLDWHNHCIVHDLVRCSRPFPCRPGYTWLYLIVSHIWFSATLIHWWVVLISIASGLLGTWMERKCYRAVITIEILTFQIDHWVSCVANLIVHFCVYWCNILCS